jgi:hypothetical protein
MPLASRALQIGLLIAFVACFASFIWAMKSHSRVAGQVPFGTQMIEVVGGIFTLAHLLALLWSGGAMVTTSAVGLALYAASFALFWDYGRRRNAGDTAGVHHPRKHALLAGD